MNGDYKDLYYMRKAVEMNYAALILKMSDNNIYKASTLLLPNGTERVKNYIRQIYNAQKEGDNVDPNKAA